ncbi:1-(5-phosphoribosyl)-5-[(5-phosphoribosylamino)methylideneamino] imidazole-4-carboxamide isomerase [Rubripirellula lacrimiformis]|uniref:1-(5-phosphoribosyl)-5-[(5-phosphoribosylamino)methylideneamino] imidazole-4-carboxamide isomerase n=1 Tax=Rubripirellula lacrimiformis TaxID=1930273 RepID=A0A517NH39_9BACT|nr:phosphoribosylformimino-5-aminoimidazole carboxamide ribotide isomerase [Rubripirellula lacrimiformis]QDT06450.1 1-(5-phosphoribosyl)-5-[(5-phosphoribosylamino)methylideneamino] imidazole-4-carboxamide isomerase [Rubripirellula lacrimiformis]
MTKFRPCIDLHDGQVKQIVGGSLRDEGGGPIENHVAEQSAGWFAAKYRDDGLTGGHVIKLGPGNDAAAREALSAYPGGLQIGGGIHAGNAKQWIDAGASHVIVTSWLFDPGGELIESRLQQLIQSVGRQRIVLDLSCRRVEPSDSGELAWRVAMNRWQTLTTVKIDHATLDRLSAYCDEFLVHAADVEGLCQGIDADLVARLASWASRSATPRPMTYAGGVATMDDVTKIETASLGKIDVTVGSSLDMFGGQGCRYQDLVKRNQAARSDH